MNSEEKLEQLKEDFEKAFITGDEVIEELESGFEKITVSKYDSLRTIKEHALFCFHDRFGDEPINRRSRKAFRRLERWLDKRGVKTWAPSHEKMGFFILVPGQARAIWCDVDYEEDKKGYSYTFTEVDKHSNFEGF